MYDTVNFTLKSVNVSSIDFLDVIPRYLTHCESTTSGGQEKLTCTLNNLYITAYHTKLTVNNSLSKFFNGNNIDNFTREDTRRAIEKLSDTLHLPFDRSTVSRLDFAYNFDVSQPPESYFYHLGKLPYYKRLQQMYNGLEGLYYSCATDNKQLVFYDKIKETSKKGGSLPPQYEGRNLLRYEMRLKQHINQNLNVKCVTAAMLYNELFYNSVLELWKTNYRNIHKEHDTSLDFTYYHGIRDINRLGVLAFIEQQGGMIEFFKELDNNLLKGALSKRQHSEMKRQITNLYKLGNCGIVQNKAIGELDALVQSVE